MCEPSSSSSPTSDSAFGAIRTERRLSPTLQVVPYARSRSTHSGSGWEDAQSANSDDLDETIEMLTVEINSRQGSSTIPAIKEESQESSKVTPRTLMDIKLPTNLGDQNSQTIIDTVMELEQKINDPIPSDKSPIDSLVSINAEQQKHMQTTNDRIDQIQTAAAQQFTAMAEKLKEGQEKQNAIVTAADSLVESLKNTLNTLQLSQTRHETVLAANESQINLLLEHNAALNEKNLELGQATQVQREALVDHEARQKIFDQQAAELYRLQNCQHQQMGEQELLTQQLQHDLAQMREQNRQRPEIPPHQQFSPNVNHQRENVPATTRTATVKEENPSKHATGSQGFTAPTGYYRQSTGQADSPFGFPANTFHGYNPLPCYGFPNMVIDSCPTFTPSTYQNWKREVKLWIAGQPGATITQLLAKLIHVLPLAVKTEALLYMDQTEKNPGERTVNHVMDMLDSRFGRTDSERACAWLTSFTDFKRETQENYKDFWARFTRCVAKLEALGMPMNNKIVFNRAIHALRLPDGQLPIVLSALETRPDRFSVDALREITIRMYETHKVGGDSSEVFATNTANPAPAENGQGTYFADDQSWYDQDWWTDEDWAMNHDSEISEIMLEDGSIMLMKPKKLSKPRNSPGSHESSRRGAVKTFSHIPNRKGKGGGKSVCLRCGDPSHHWKDCPHPFREKLDPRFSSKGKGKTFTVEESPTPITQPEGETHITIPQPEPVVTESACPSGSNETPERVPQPSMNDIWAQYYAHGEGSTTNLVNVCHTIHLNLPESHTPGKRESRNLPPPILIDSGASCSVVGQKWIDSWGRHLNWPKRIASSREFRFGDGPPFASQGEMHLPILIPKERTSDSLNHILTFKVDVVAALIPMLISQQALSHMEGKMDFSRFTLELPGLCTIQLTRSSTGHVLLPGFINQDSLDYQIPSQHHLFPMQQTTLPLRQLTDAEVLKIHQQLGHCSEKQLLDLLRFGKCKADATQVSRITRRCNCQRSVHRITPPVVSSWIARFSGEVVAIDIVHPFTEIGPDGLFPLWKNTGKIVALLVVDSLTRFISCQILKSIASEVVTQVFMNDWVKHFGKPKRIILDQGGPGLDGKEWKELSHIFGWQYICAPVRTPHQNGLAERTVRSLKAAVQSIAQNENHTQPSQSLLTLAVIAKNHAPHAVTGLPPAFAMTGRCDIASGASTCMWEHDPLSHDSLIPQMNSLKKIIDARNAVIQADSTHAIRTCLNRNRRDNVQEHFPIGASVQLAVDSQWVGTFRVIAHSAGNLLVERGNKILKWPKCKTRLVNLENNDAMDEIHIPAEGKMWNRRRRGKNDEYPEEFHPENITESRASASAPETINVRDSPLTEGELMEAGQRSLDTPDSIVDIPEDSHDVGVIFHSMSPSHAAMEGSYVNHGAILCERILDLPPGDRLDATYSTYHAMGPMLAKGFTYSTAATIESQVPQRKHNRETTEYIDQDILDGFDPSRIPPRVAFKLQPARIAIEKEITDLLTAKPHEPPAMIEVALNDSRYAKIPRVHSTLVVKRKGSDSYKGRLCVRGDTVPLQNTAFVSSPTAHRCAVKIICAVASQLQWVIHAVDVSQAFLQSSNLNPRDRVIVIPPNMIQLPWQGKLPPMHTDLSHVTHRRGFLLLRPLYGGRDAPMRWFLSLSKRLREHGFIQMKTDVCIYSKRDSHGELTGILVAHVDDLLYCGTPTFRKEAYQAITTFRTGELETLTKTSPIIFTGMLLELDSPTSILLSQQMYAEELPTMEISEYIQESRIVNQAGLKSTFKQGLGALIWLHQTRPDIGFTITQMATQIVEACESADKAIQLMRLYNKIVKFVKNHRRKIRYSAFPTPNVDSSARPSDLLHWKLFMFTDAGFGTLIKNHSIESHVIVLGDVIGRDGVIQCHGLLLDHRCAKIHRVCRSTLAAEAHAAVTAVDVALWFQVLLTEIFTHHFDYQLLTPPTHFPLRNPFHESPSNAEVTEETTLERILLMAAVTHSANPMITETPETTRSTCLCCQRSMVLTTFAASNLDSHHRSIYESLVQRRPAILFHPMVLTDCCSLYSAILRLQPKTVERCTRITLAFLRDSLEIVAFSYIDATVNIGDVGTKHAGSLGILDHFLDTGRFTLSFVGRKKRKPNMS